MARSKRLAFLSELTKGYDRVIDIGCDHGYVLKDAFDNYGITGGIATDVRKGPLDRARKTLIGYPVSFYETDGFQGVFEPFDLAIIAGMGAHMIVDILKRAPDHDFDCLLQANGKEGVLRRGIENRGFRIIDEYVLLSDGRFYVIIKAARGKMELSDEDRLLGPFLRKKSEAIPFYSYRIEGIERIKDSVDDEKRRVFERELSYYRKAIRLLKSQ